MKLLYTIIFLFSTTLFFAQDTLKNNYPTHFISQIELRYELIDLGKTKTNSLQFGNQFSFDLHKEIKPFSPEEMPPYFDLELSEKSMIDYQSGFEVEGVEFFSLAENATHHFTRIDHYSSTEWVFTTNYDEKESVNFYKTFSNNQKVSIERYGSMTSLLYQKEKFFRSVFELNLGSKIRGLHFNFSHINNLFYRHESNTPILFGDRNNVYFPKKYHERKSSELIHSSELQNQNIRGTAIFAKLYFSPFKKTYLKFESDLHSFYFSRNQRERQNFRTVGIGVKPFDETFIFLEYTNRPAALGNISIFSFQKEEPYYAISAKRILKLKLFKR